MGSSSVASSGGDVVFFFTGAGGVVTDGGEGAVTVVPTGLTLEVEPTGRNPGLVAGGETGLLSALDSVTGVGGGVGLV